MAAALANVNMTAVIITVIICITVIILSIIGGRKEKKYETEFKRSPVGSRHDTTADGR